MGDNTTLKNLLHQPPQGIQQQQLNHQQQQQQQQQPQQQQQQMNRGSLLQQQQQMVRSVNPMMVNQAQTSQRTSVVMPGLMKFCPIFRMFVKYKS